MNFKKYNSIENSFDEEFVGKVKGQIPADQIYVVQEKVHGANTCFLCDGTDIQFAKRTAIVADGEIFYDYESLMDEHRERVLALTRDVMNTDPDVEQVCIFGELFGGKYAHPDVEKVKNATLVQKGICYCPGHGFYGFDIYLQTADGGRFLDVEHTNALFENHGFFYARTLFSGTLDECLAHPNAFITHIPEWLGLPPIEDNICEGIVIRPVVPLFLRSGNRVLIKSKNERFAEKKGVKKSRPAFDAAAEYSDELNDLISELERYINPARLDNVISHIGEVDMFKDFGKVTGLLAKDAFEDFMKENALAFDELEKTEQKSLKKELTKLATNIVRGYQK